MEKNFIKLFNELSEKLIGEKVEIRLEEEFLKRVKIICVKKGITFQDAVKMLLEKWVEESEGE